MTQRQIRQEVVQHGSALYIRVARGHQQALRIRREKNERLMASMFVMVVPQACVDWS